MAAFRGILFQEMYPGSPREQWSYADSKVVRIFKIAWRDRFLFRNALLGYPTLVDTSPEPYISRTTPHVYPSATSIGKVYATNITSVVGCGVPDVDDMDDPDEVVIHESVPFPLRPLKDEDDLSNYKYAIVTVEYEPRLYSVLEDNDVIDPATGNPTEKFLERYVSVRWKPITELFTVGPGGAKWADDAPGSGRQTVPRPIPKREAKVNVDITWHQLPFIPQRAAELMAAVNDATVDISPATSSGAGDPPGTMLLVGVDTVLLKSRAIIDQQLYDIVYHFVRFEPAAGKGHNYIFDAFGNPARYRLITDTGDDPPTGKTIYPPRDLLQLFVPE